MEFGAASMTTNAVRTALAPARAAVMQHQRMETSDEARGDKPEPPERQQNVPPVAALPSTTLAFDVGNGGETMTVTMSDRNSGEVYRKLVYDRGARLQSALRADRGCMVDVVR